MIKESEQRIYVDALRRIGWLIPALGLCGAAAVAAVKGTAASLAFLLGAAVSYASFRGLRHVVDALGPGAKRRRPVIFIARMLLLVIIACAIIKFLGLNVAAAALGLLVSAAAVILEIIFELIYARA